MKYRPEVDGLRALAIIPVILFHAGFKTFSGGFVGVDIFFVISGYLITTIILSEKENGTFSLANFYERRARRIFPALFLVLAVSLPFSWAFLFPSEMKAYSQSLVATSIFSSNILFWMETGYWGASNELKPLLHTWSLAVEEQFYVIFPLFLSVMWGARRRWVFITLSLLTAISLIASHWGAYNQPSGNFFLLPTRAWELAIGALIAFAIIYRKESFETLSSHRWICETLSFAGLIMIAFSIFAFHESTPHPSFYSLIPTVGAGLIILFSSKNTTVGKLLGLKLPVAIGLISYSAYLWHQPIFSLSRHISLTEPDAYFFSILVAFTFLCAYLSWQFIEKPFRSKNTVSRSTIIKLGVVGSLIFTAIGLAGHLTNGFSDVFSQNKSIQEEIDEKMTINHGLSKACNSSRGTPYKCRTATSPEILIWGDSYAMHLVQGIIASNPNAKIIQMTKSSCGPFFDIAPVPPKYPMHWALGCLKFTDHVRNWIKTNSSISHVVISSPFSQYLQKDWKLLHRDGNTHSTGLEITLTEFWKTLDELKSLGVTPVIFSPPPSSNTNIGSCLAKAEWRHISLDNCNFNTSLISKQRKSVYQLLNRVSSKYRVIRLDKLICDDHECKTHIDNTWLYRDGGHLSHAGSAAIGLKYNFYQLIVNRKSKGHANQ